MAESIYEIIGKDYAKNRKADNRIVDSLYSLLGLPSGSTVADVGAGTGSYSIALANRGYKVKAIEPSGVMRMQSSSHERIDWIAGYAENIPLKNYAVDGVVVVFAIHHFSSLEDAARELYRICPSGPVVIFTIDHRESVKFWIEDYFTEIVSSMYHKFPPINDVVETIVSGKPWHAEKVKFPLPYNLTDKFMDAGWRNPEMYLDQQIRQSISLFALADTDVVKKGIERLRDDLKTGKWDEKYGHIRQQDYFDAGYRFLKFTLK